MFREKKKTKDKDQNVNSGDFPVSGIRSDFNFYFCNLQRNNFLEREDNYPPKAQIYQDKGRGNTTEQRVSGV